MSPTHDSSCRQVYLLTLWREIPDAPWRAALRQAAGQDRIGFADLEALALFLLRLDEPAAGPPNEANGMTPAPDSS